MLRMQVVILNPFYERSDRMRKMFFFIVIKDKVFKNDGENMIRLGKSEVFKINAIVHKLVNELFLEQ